MLIRLIPPSPHPSVLYALTFPNVLSLPNLGPGAVVPPAWSSQLQIITSFLQLDPPSNIHMLDRAVGLVARTREVSMNIPQKEIVLRFVDGQVASVPMNSDCVRMLLDVVLDVKGCSELESQRNSIDSSACLGSTAGSAEDIPPPLTPTKSTKTGKHKKQRSLLFSLISSLVPKSLSSSLSPLSPPPTAPPRTPLPPLPAAARATSPISSQFSKLPLEPDPDFFRQRARATLIDVWRRHVLTAISPKHLPPAGYAEWTLIAMAGKVRAEIDSMKTVTLRSRGSGVNSHRRAKSEGRHALDFGDCRSGYVSERFRPPSPFPGMLVDGEDADRVVYPRREQTDEWGVRYIDHARSFDEADIYAVEFYGHNDSLLDEQLMVNDNWGDNERLTFDLSPLERHDYLDIPSSSLVDRPDLGLVGSSDGNRITDMTFDMSRTPLVPSDVNGDESDDSQLSLRTPEGEELPLAPPGNILQAPTQHSAPRSTPVSRVTSSRPRSRDESTQFSNANPTSGQASQPLTFSVPSLNIYGHDSRDAYVDETIDSHYEHLERVCNALEVVRSRAHEEGWRLARATMIGAKDGWIDAQTELTLEIRAKRRAWSSGIRIYAPYTPATHSMLGLWDGGYSTFRSPMSPPGLKSHFKRTPQVCGLIVPTGLSLGIPQQSSPLAMYAWSVDDEQTLAPGKQGILSSVQNMGTVEGRRSSRISFVDGPTKLFPVCEDEGEESYEPARVNGVGFPREVTLVVSTQEPKVAEGPGESEEDPFGFCPSRPRTRTKSMFMAAPTPTPPSTPVLPMFRPGTPPPSYQAAVGGNDPNDEEARLGTSALLLQPLSSLSVTPSPFASNSPFVPRPRAVSLPTVKSVPTMNKTRRTSFQHKEERYEDLSRTYASPPPEGPLVISAIPAPHEQYPRYAHVQPPISAGKKSINASVLRRKGREVTFEQAGSEFTVGIEVALGRAEEGRVVWS